MLCSSHTPAFRVSQRCFPSNPWFAGTPPVGAPLGLPSSTTLTWLPLAGSESKSSIYSCTALPLSYLLSLPVPPDQFSRPFFLPFPLLFLSTSQRLSTPRHHHQSRYFAALEPRVSHYQRPSRYDASDHDQRHFSVSNPATTHLWTSQIDIFQPDFQTDAGALHSRPTVILKATLRLRVSSLHLAFDMRGFVPNFSCRLFQLCLCHI